MKYIEPVKYQEFEPSAYLSKHVECYWELDVVPDELDSKFEVLSPDCTFEIIFSAFPICLRQINGDKLLKVPSGAAFVGQKTTSVKLVANQPVKIFGVRFKPFAFANLIDIPLYKMNDKVCPLQEVFSMSKWDSIQVQEILLKESGAEQVAAVEVFLSKLLKESFDVDQQLRAQMNYILDRKGIVKIMDMFSSFGVSKATLRNHFVQKMGLTPKKVSRIWRINYFLHLQKSMPDRNLTELGLTAGYYDQAHFIKEFRYFFGDCHRQFFKNNSQLLGISQAIISRRFANQYDPK